jgi:hypothetical protein
MATRFTGGYDGSTDIITSVANTEVIPQPIKSLSNTTISPYINAENTWAPSNRTYFESFYFYNDGAIHVQVNGERIIYLRTGQNFEVDKGDPAIFSFIILDNAVNYSWTGIYV